MRFWKKCTNCCELFYFFVFFLILVFSSNLTEITQIHTKIQKIQKFLQNLHFLKMKLQGPPWTSVDLRGHLRGPPWTSVGLRGPAWTIRRDSIFAFFIFLSCFVEISGKSMKKWILVFFCKFHEIQVLSTKIRHGFSKPRNCPALRESVATNFALKFFWHYT